MLEEVNMDLKQARKNSVYDIDVIEENEYKNVPNKNTFLEDQ